MQDGQGGTVGTYSREESEGYDYCSKVTLYEGYHVDEIYYLKMGYNSAVGNIPSAVTAAYVGRYSSIGEAAADGAENIKDILFAGDNSTEKGYGADYSQGVDFTIFVGEDGSPGQKVYHCRVRTEEGTSLPSDYNWIVFSGLKGVDGEDIPCYVVPLSYDSFGSANFYTILVGGEVDVSSLIPVFRTPSGARVFTTGSSVPETSGVSAHDFSKGAVLYTVSQEEGVQMVKNYWLQVVKAKSGRGRLYINSLEDAGAGTREENGVIYSTREVVLDYYHRNRHDILLMNIGTDAIPNLSAELESDVVELDEYWTLKGNYSLPGLSTLTKETEHGELPNFAQLRMKAKDGVEEGTEISGTLTIKSGTEPLMVLTLTGVIGSPRIITEELPQSLKCTLWVPYGTFIQNNNKYSWNKISYSLADGSLPAGMELRENGEIYGVPEETGEFTFTVRMTNSTESFPDDMKTYTLAVERNTDENAEASTDPGYELIQRVPDFQAGMATADSRTLVSVGPYEEFVDIYLDGRKLERGSEYTSEPGSTRITVRSQTLTPPGAAGTHTLGVEFRTKDTGLLKRAAQNYKVGYDVPDNGDSGSGDGNSGGNNGGSGNGGADKDGESGGNGGNADNGGGNPAGEGGVSGGDGPGDDVGAAVSSAVRAVAIAVSTTDTDAVIRYTVKSGDTLWKIAEKFYGAGKYWQKVFEDNRAVIGNPNRIYAGQVIVIYKAQADISARQGNPSAGGSGGSLYTVEAGDTLWKIAREVYGQGWRWRQIYRANADTVREPGDIYAGQALFIPEG